MHQDEPVRITGHWGNLGALCESQHGKALGELAHNCFALKSRVRILWGTARQDEATQTYWKHYFYKPYPTTGQILKTLSHIKKNKKARQITFLSSIEHNNKIYHKHLNPHLHQQEKPCPDKQASASCAYPLMHC